MAEVMPRGHGGDGSEDPPPPGGFWRGSHEEDAVPARKAGRGSAKNKKLVAALKKNNGRPLSLIYDRNATFVPIGEVGDMFVREIGMYMWRNIAFDKQSWENVSEAEKNALKEHLSRRFNLEEIESDPQASLLKGGIEHVLSKRYRDRKNKAKTHFNAVGGKGNIEVTKTKPPKDMGLENWGKAVDFFTSDSHENRASVNRTNRQKQQYTNRGGTASYSSYAYKNKMSELEVFRKAHIRRDGTFDSELAERQYNDLRLEFESAGQPNSEDEIEESCEPSATPVEIFEKVMGPRRGHRRGIGPKPSLGGSSSFVSQREPESTQEPFFTEAQLDRMFSDPAFLARLTQQQAASNKRIDNDTQDDNEDEEDD